MRLIIASDIHGAADACARLLQAADEIRPDKLVLLGDVLYHGPRNDLPADYDPRRVAAMLNARATEIVCVRGNCDAEVDQMVLDFCCTATYNQLFDPAWGHTLFLTHGHVFGPGLDNAADKLPALASGDALVFGHTHVKRQEPCPGRPDVLCFNPGSVGIPKDGSASFGLYENGTFSHVLM